MTRANISGWFLAWCVLVRKHSGVSLDDKLKLDQALITVNNYLPDQINAFYVSDACSKVSRKGFTERIMAWSFVINCLVLSRWDIDYIMCLEEQMLQNKGWSFLSPVAFSQFELEGHSSTMPSVAIKSWASSTSAQSSGRKPEISTHAGGGGGLVHTNPKALILQKQMCQRYNVHNLLLIDKTKCLCSKHAHYLQE